MMRMKNLLTPHPLISLPLQCISQGRDASDLNPNRSDPTTGDGGDIIQARQSLSANVFQHLMVSRLQAQNMPPNKVIIPLIRLRCLLENECVTQPMFFPILKPNIFC